jgi:hypothetical protein
MDAEADLENDARDAGPRSSLRALRDSRWGLWLVALLATVPALAFSARLPEAREYEVSHEDAMSRFVRSKLFYEYIPKSMEWRPHTTTDLEKAPSVPEPRAFLQGARGRLTVDEWSSHGRRLRVVADRDGVLHVGTFVYAGWQATIDGLAAEISTTDIGLIQLPITRGEHEVELRFVPTPERVMAAWISGVAAAVLLAVAAGRAIRRGRGALARARRAFALAAE